MLSINRYVKCFVIAEVGNHAHCQPGNGPGYKDWLIIPCGYQPLDGSSQSVRTGRPGTSTEVITWVIGVTKKRNPRMHGWSG
jgi:hypothetical protein